MSDLIEYFVRHYTLVIDNDEVSYTFCREAVRAAIREVADEMTAAEYVALGETERRGMFASAIGANVLALVEEWTNEVLDQHDGSMGVQLIREVLVTNGGDIAYALGEYYMPEDNEAADFFTEDDE